MNETVYRTSPETTTEWEQRKERANQARREAGLAFLQRHGFPETTLFWGSPHDIYGLNIGTNAEPPTGWRRDRDYVGVIKPDRRTRVGRQAAAELGEIPSGNAREGLPGGMPSMAISRQRGVLMEPGLAVLAGRLYVTWSHPLEEREAARIDSQVWETVRLSEYHAAREAEEQNA